QRNAPVALGHRGSPRRESFSNCTRVIAAHLAAFAIGLSTASPAVAVDLPPRLISGDALYPVINSNCDPDLNPELVAPQNPDGVGVMTDPIIYNVFWPGTIDPLVRATVGDF